MESKYQARISELEKLVELEQYVGNNLVYRIESLTSSLKEERKKTTNLEIENVKLKIELKSAREKMETLAKKYALMPLETVDQMEKLGVDITRSLTLI